MSQTPVPSPVRVLLVDASPSSLAAYARQIGALAEVVTCTSGAEAVRRVEAGEHFAVVLCDLAAGPLDGMATLARLQAAAPEMVRVLFSGEADLETVFAAMNSGAIFRFLQKPCLPAAMKACLEGALEQHRLQSVDREVLAGTGAEAVHLLAELMALASPAGYRRARRLERTVGHMARARGLEDVWQVELAALLSCLSTLILEDDAFERFATGHPASADERRAFTVQPRVAAAMLDAVPRFQVIAAMVRRAGEIPGGTASASDAVEAGAALIATAAAYDVEIARGATRDDALLRVTLQLQGRKGMTPCLEALGSLPPDPARSEVHGTDVASLAPGMVLNAPIRTVCGLLLAAAGQPITPTLLHLVREYHAAVGVSEPIHVHEVMAAA